MRNLRYDLFFTFLAGVLGMAALASWWWWQYGRPPAEQ